MTEVRLKYLHSFVDQHDHVRYYFRYRGTRWTLPGHLDGNRDSVARVQLIVSPPCSSQARSLARPGKAVYGSPSERRRHFRAAMPSRTRGS